MECLWANFFLPWTCVYLRTRYVYTTQFRQSVKMWPNMTGGRITRMANNNTEERRGYEMKILCAQLLLFIAASSKQLYSSYPWPPLTCQRTLRYTDMVSSNNFLWKTCWICRKRSRKKWATSTSKISCEVKENYPWNLRLVTWSVWGKVIEFTYMALKNWLQGRLQGQQF